MADLYSVITGLQPDTQDILEAELLAKQILEAQFPDLDLREGTGVRDLVLRPSAFLLALCKKGYDSYFAQNTLAGITDTTPTEVVDDILGNLFLERKTGTYAIINARLYFARQKSVALSTDISFSPDGAILFYPATAVSFPQSSLQYDSFNNEWYIDVDLKAGDKGTEFNLSEGSLLYFSNFDPYFLHAEINYLIQESTAAETNTEFVSRASTAISTRNLINKPSILSNIGENLNTVDLIYPVGSGDEEMYRDLVKVKIENASERRLTSAAYISPNKIQATLAAHGFTLGQTIYLRSAVPAEYNMNGQAVVTQVLDDSTFQWDVSGNFGPFTVLPYVQGERGDLYIHQGGTVDVYCGNEFVSEINQYTVSPSGLIEIEGPIVSIARSEISGGSDPDTMPLAPVVPFTSVGAFPYRFNAPSGTLTTGDVVKVSGYSQQVPISSINCSSIGFVTAHVVGHKILSTGSLVTISGVTPAEYNGTFTCYRQDADNFNYQVSSRIPTAGAGVSMLAINAGINSGLLPNDTGYGIVTASSTYFDVAMPNLWAGVAVTGTPVVTKEPPFTLIRNEYTSRHDGELEIFTDTLGSVNRLTLPDNPLIPGRYVRLFNSNIPANNDVWKVTESINSETVSIDGVNNGFLSGTGVVSVEYVSPLRDNGFSMRQLTTVDYGVAQAGKTVSLELTSFNNLSNVQEYLDGSDNRVLCGDLLARGFDVYELDVSLISYNVTAPAAGLVTTIIEKYLKSLGNGSVFIVSDLVSELTAGGIENLRTPISIRAKFYNRDLFPTNFFEIQDVFDPKNTTAIFVLGSVTTSAALL